MATVNYSWGSVTLWGCISLKGLGNHFQSKSIIFVFMCTPGFISQLFSYVNVCSKIKPVASFSVWKAYTTKLSPIWSSTQLSVIPVIKFPGINTTCFFYSVSDPFITITNSLFQWDPLVSHFYLFIYIYQVKLFMFTYLPPPFIMGLAFQPSLTSFLYY